MSDTTASTANATIELTAEREIVLQGATKSYHITCRRITPADWAAFFAAIVVGSRSEGGDRINTLDIQTARLQLAEAVVVRETGYTAKTPDGGSCSLSELPDWQRLLPLEHRLAIGGVLSSARPIDVVDDELIYPEGEPVTLGCTWSADANGDMAYTAGLVHLLKMPSEAQHHRYMQEASRTRILGGSRSGETLYPGAQAVLAALYDELIVSVEGYTVNGQPLEGRENIAREMDMHHKVMAAQEIFQPRKQVTLKTAKTTEVAV